jgi:heme/copper-type cytochrome/quinol oxidase subunit 2
VLITDLLPAVIALAVVSGALLITVVVLALCVIKYRKRARKLPTAKQKEEENNYEAVEVRVLSR